MKTGHAFFDTSVLVPLCVWQQASRRADELYRNFSVVVWWATAVEVDGALARLFRSGELDAGEYMQAKLEAEEIALDLLVIRPSPQIAAHARSFPALYPLRAADALQLAAAMAWCEDSPSGQTFLTGDRRLAEAAQLAGFSVELVI